MATVQRPLSPHLQIYKWQITMVLSIAHRATGIFLSLGALVLCYWLLSISMGEAVYARTFQHLNAWYGQVVLVLFTFSFYYHLCNGIRHLFWDAGKGLEIKTMYRSGYAVILSSLGLTIVSCYMGGLL